MRWLDRILRRDPDIIAVGVVNTATHYSGHNHIRQISEADEGGNALFEAYEWIEGPLTCDDCPPDV